MRAVVTGAGGFLGAWLTARLDEASWQVTGFTHHTAPPIDLGRIALEQVDIEDLASLRRAVTAIRPDVIFHLAALSLPNESWRDPSAFIRTNIGGTVNLIEAIRSAAPSALLVNTGTSQEYGHANGVLHEETVIVPASPYAVTKAAAAEFCRLHARANHLRVVHVRPFQIVGPGKTGDALSDFARGIVAVERGEASSLRVGNLDAVRDVMDVRDAANAFITIASHTNTLPEVPADAETYNIATGQGIPLRSLLDLMVTLATVPIRMETDPERMRPADIATLVGDSTRLRRLGWTPAVPLSDVVRDILDYWRQR